MLTPFASGLLRLGWSPALAAAIIALNACASDGSTQVATPGGKLYARGLSDITDLYIEPISNHQLALAGMKGLTRLDGKFAVTENPVPGTGSTELAWSYGGKPLGSHAEPQAGDSRGWGEVLGDIAGAAKAASPRVAAMSDDAISKAVFDGMAGALDRFSHYSSPDMARDQRAARDGFGGIGVTLDEGDPLGIAEVSAQGPAERAGLQVGDKIAAIDGVATAGQTQAQIVHRLRGPIASKLDLTIARAGLPQPRQVELQRALVVVSTVTVKRDGDVAIFRVASFNQSTTQRLAEELAGLRDHGGTPLTGIILDLRGDPGGLLDQAVSIADQFIHAGPIVATIGRHPASRQYFAATGSGVAPRVPMVVLVNGGSASSSEIVAAALQDAGRAVVVGTASYGKGTVQTVLRLPNDGELTLTWARLVTPAGYLLQSHGVVPTLCTSDLGDDDRSWQTALQRATAGAGPSPLAPQARASLDERGWAELRQSCPGKRTTPEIDVKLAERILADPRLYGEAVRAIKPTSQLARISANARPAAAALTGPDRAVSSPARLR